MKKIFLTLFVAMSFASCSNETSNSETKHSPSIRFIKFHVESMLMDSDTLGKIVDGVDRVIVKRNDLGVRHVDRDIDADVSIRVGDPADRLIKTFTKAALGRDQAFMLINVEHFAFRTSLESEVQKSFQEIVDADFPR